MNIVFKCWFLYWCGSTGMANICQTAVGNLVEKTGWAEWVLALFVCDGISSKQFFASVESGGFRCHSNPLPFSPFVFPLFSCSNWSSYLNTFLHFQSGVCVFVFVVYSKRDKNPPVATVEKKDCVVFQLLHCRFGSEDVSRQMVNIENWQGLTRTRENWQESQRIGRLTEPTGVEPLCWLNVVLLIKKGNHNKTATSLPRSIVKRRIYICDNSLLLNGLWISIAWMNLQNVDNML